MASIPATVVWAAFFGIAAALAGFIDGIVLMAKHTPGTCQITSRGGDPATVDCTVHPHFGEGFAISAISFSVGVAILLLAYLSGAMLSGSEAR